MKRLSVVLTAFTASLLLTLAVAAPASAHTSLIDVTPGEGSTVTEGDTVTLTFSEDLLTIGAEATVTDSTGTASSLEVSFPVPSSAQVVLPDLAGGAVLVAWRVVANDGHPVEGALTLVAEASATPPATSAATAPTPAPGAPAAATLGATPTPEVDESPSAEAGTGSNGVPVAIWVAVAAAFLAFGAFMLARNRRP